MTSPHAASEEVVATMATTAFDDSPTTNNANNTNNTIDLTAAAADNAAPVAHVAPEVNTAPLTMEERDKVHEENVASTEHLQITTESTTTPNAETSVPSDGPQTPPAQIRPDIMMEPAIPQTPEMDGNGDESEFPHVTMAEYQQLETLSHLMSYRAPPGFSEAMNASAMNASAMAMATLSANGISMDNSVISRLPYDDAPQYSRDNDETRISAYALLEFEDGQFYMNTYSVILGRDLAAARAAMRRDAEEQKMKTESEGAREPKTPVRIKREESRYTKSVISESGGILRDGDDSDSDARTRRRMYRKASKKSKSTGSSSHRISRRASLVQPNGKIDYQPQPQARRHAPDTVGAVPVDPASLRPSPHDCPLVGIHPPATTPASGYKAISRRHVKIAYNSRKCLFEAEIIGRNGAFVDDVFYYHQDIIPLKSGSYLQIGGVVVRFVLPDVAIGETGAEITLDHEEGSAPERYAEGGKEMSFDFDNATRDGVLLGDSSDGSDEADRPQQGVEDDGEEDEGEGEDREEGQDGDEDDEDISELSDLPDEEEEERDHQDDQRNEAPDFSFPMPQKKRGPGRPPKNGIMSKREQQLAKKEAQQREAQKMIYQPDISLSGKNKVGRPRKNPLDEFPVKTEKRKYTKRKPKDPDALAVKQEGSGDEERPSKEKKEKKSTKPPRSPSPTFNEADLTPEQLSKPQANYVTLIHEALSNSPTGQMSLPQIYRAIQRRYPFFVLKCNTNGWQSSVRHNLSQHHAFRKVERDGKGWMWAIVDGVSIEKEKKRRPTPPHQLPPHLQHQPIYRAGPPPPHMMHGPPGMMPPPAYMHPNMPPHLRPGQPPYVGQPMNGYPLPPGSQPHMNGLPPPGFAPAMPIVQAMGAPNNTYSSPYAPKPPGNPSAPQAPPSMPQTQTQPLAQAAPYQAQPPRPIQQASQQPNNAITRLIENFRGALVTSIKSKTSKAEALVASAINRVMGISTKSTAANDQAEEKAEEQIIAALKNMLSKFPGSGFNAGPSQQSPALQISHGQPTQQNGAPRQALAQITPQHSGNTPHGVPDAAAKPPTPGPAVQRPSFAGQAYNRPTGPSVPRPPMLTPGMSRTNSGSPANPSIRTGVSASASPAPPAPATPVLAVNNAPQQPPPSAPTASLNSVQQQQPPLANVQQPMANIQKPVANMQQAPSPSMQQGHNSTPPVMNENGKRPLEDDDMSGGNDFKRLGTSGLPALKT